MTDYDPQVQKVMDVIMTKPLRTLSNTELALARAYLSEAPMPLEEVARAVKQIQQEQRR